MLAINLTVNTGIQTIQFRTQRNVGPKTKSKRIALKEQNRISTDSDPLRRACGAEIRRRSKQERERNLLTGN